jgi:hypothetical protein
MNLKQLEKLYDSKDAESIVLANNTIKAQISNKNVYSLLSMLTVKYYNQIPTDSDLDEAFKNKLQEDTLWDRHVLIANITVTKIFQHLLQKGDVLDLKQIKEVREYYNIYIDSLIKQIEYKQNSTTEENEEPFTPF